MLRLGFVIGTLLPVALLAVNLALGYGGILVTIGLLVWLGTGILLTPTSARPGGPAKPRNLRGAPCARRSRRACERRAATEAFREPARDRSEPYSYQVTYRGRFIYTG